MENDSVVYIYDLGFRNLQFLLVGTVFDVIECHCGCEGEKKII